MINSLKASINSSVLVIIIPILFIVLLFMGSTFYKKGKWNEEYLSLSQVRVIKGFCALGIILHHLAQKTAAPWLDSKYTIHGLDFFVNIGYLFVAVFLFISGYGLYKSYKTKNDYLDNFLSRRILPVALAYITTSLIYYLYKQIDSTYTWYVAAIIYCYLLFYLCFKYCKKDSLALFLILLGIIVYCAFCKFMLFGGWCYNVIGLFFIGLVYAKYETSIVNIIKKIYLPLLLVIVVSTFICNYYGRYYEVTIFNVTNESTYDLYSLLIILFRFIAGICFTFGLILVSLKVSFKNKILEFYGKISLEFYLIQGIFVQMFSYCYFFETVKPLYYIKNIPLYIIVVVSLSTVSAYLLNYIHKRIIYFFNYFYKRNYNEVNVVKKSLKKLMIALVLILIAYIGFCSVYSVTQNRNINNSIKEYKEKYLSFADVDNKKMAAYVVGNGDNTLVFMRGNDDPCPTLTMKYLADSLSSDYRVVVLDYLGTGFSDSCSTSRTSKNIASEIHEALNGLGINSNYILVPEYISGLYAQEYVKQYGKEVKGVIALESENIYLYNEIVKNSGLSQMEYFKHQKKTSFINYCLGRLVNIKGFDILIWQVIRPTYQTVLKDVEEKVVKKTVLDNIYNSAYVDEMRNTYENYKKSMSAQYPRKSYVIDILDNSSIQYLKNNNINSEEMHARACFDRAKHKTIIVNDMYKLAFYEVDTFKSTIEEALDYIK